LSADDLDDKYLTRAAILLSFLAHAYWRHGVDRAFQVRLNSIGADLPPCIFEPWQTVNRRLGRGNKPYQSFYDIFFNNFKILNPTVDNCYDLKDITIENLDVLVPIFNNDAERVFFMSFVEMHALGSPIIGMICDIEEKLEKKDKNVNQDLIKFFDDISAILKACLRTLLKISPIAASKTYCDPILWSKTIAIFSVAPSGALQGGTSGAFSPLTMVLDALLNRQNYESEYGQYVLSEKAKLLPDTMLDFIMATSEIKIADYIMQLEKTDPGAYETLKDSYNNLIEIYAGSDGFLGKHTSKVFNYLGISTMVGRNQSTSGDERFVHQNTWVDVCSGLKIARLERKDQDLIEGEVTNQFPKPDISELNVPDITRMELAEHHTREDCWIAVNGFVYDVSDFLAKHPGGDTIMLAYAGRDVSQHFNTITSHLKPSIPKLMLKMLVGKYENTKSDNKGIETWMEFVNRLLFIRSITAAQYHHMVDKKLEILFAGHTHTHFIHEHVGAIIDALPFKEKIGALEGEAWETLCHTEFITSQDLRGSFSDTQLVHFAYVAQLFEKESLSLVDEMIEFILERIESGQELDENTSKTCLSITLRWLKSHLKTIKIIERQEVSLFGHSLMDYIPEEDNLIEFPQRKASK